MPRSGRSKPKDRTKKKTVTKVDERPTSRILPRSQERGNPNVPVRTVLYVEVGDLPTAQVQELCRHLLKGLSNEHPHYIVPLRSGRLTSEIVFEKEFLSTVRAVCEIKDDEIVLKGGAQNVDIIRKKV